MTEQMGEHTVHHSSKKDGDFSSYVLPLSILLAAVIMGYSMVSAANTLADSWGGALPIGGGDALPTPEQGAGDLQPTQSMTMAELLSTDYAGKLGSDSAPVVMVEYSDFQCPFCRRYEQQTYGVLVEKYVNTGKLQIVFKDFPLGFHPMAVPYANAARCAGEQGKFWEMHDKIFDEQQIIDPSGGTVSSVTNDDVKDWAEELGLNTSSFNTCFDSSKYQSSIDATFAEGAANGVSGTPSFVIGLRDEKGQLVVGAQPTATFEATIEGLLQ